MMEMHFCNEHAIFIAQANALDHTARIIIDHLSSLVNDNQ